MISNKPRAATITALEDTHIATLDRRTFNIIKKNHENVLNKKIETLRGIPGFELISRMALMKHQKFFKENNYIRGSKVLEEGKPIEDLHLIVEGEFMLHKSI